MIEEDIQSFLEYAENEVGFIITQLIVYYHTTEDKDRVLKVIDYLTEGLDNIYAADELWGGVKNSEE